MNFNRSSSDAVSDKRDMQAKWKQMMTKRKNRTEIISNHMALIKMQLN